MLHHSSSLLLLSCLTWAVVGCGRGEGFSVEGKTSLERYSSVVLADMEKHTLDSTAIEGGTFRLTVDGNVEHPYPAVMHLINPGDSSDWMEMPVVVENGQAKFSLDEYIRIGGTPLNDAVQEFLNGLQDCKDNLSRRTDIGEGEILQAFSQYYLQQITIHRHDALGAYIFRTYGIHLSREDAQKAKAVLEK